jgi:hypothetical protein
VTNAQDDAGNDLTRRVHDPFEQQSESRRPGTPRAQASAHDALVDHGVCRDIGDTDPCVRSAVVPAASRRLMEERAL